MRTTALTRGPAGDPGQLDQEQWDLWLEAVSSVDEVANSTDSASSSKAPLTALQQLVRTHPVAVVGEISRLT